MFNRLITLAALVLPASAFASVSVPEPSTVALFALGGVALGVAQWWKKRK
jgi:hypothetical protein